MFYALQALHAMLGGVAYLAKDGMQLLHQACIFFDGQNRGTTLQQLACQASLAWADLKHAVAWLEVCSTSNGLEQGCVSQKVLAQRPAQCKLIRQHAWICFGIEGQTVPGREW